MILTNDYIVENKTLSLFKQAALILGFAFLTGVSASLKIEIGMVPITLQTMVVLLSGAVLGSKRGALSQILYALMGLSGIFWFARGGGITYVLSPTFGYIIGFVMASYISGLLLEKRINTIAALFMADIMIYIPGLLWLSSFVGFEKVLAIGLFPFIFGDLIKVLLAGLVLLTINKPQSFEA